MSCLNIFSAAWSQFESLYDRKGRRLAGALRTKGWSEEQITKDHWVVWKEADLAALLYSLMYTSQDLQENLEIHLAMKLSPGRFDNYPSLGQSFRAVGQTLKKSLRLKRVYYPEVDIFVCDSLSDTSLELGVQLKLYHYDPSERFGRTVKEEISKDMQTMKVMKENGVFVDVALAVVDDYFWWNPEKKQARVDLEKSMSKAEAQGISIFYHDSKAFKQSLTSLRTS